MDIRNDRVVFTDTHRGYEFLVRHIPDYHFCGYVKLPETDKFYNVDHNSIPVDVHGELTFGEFTHDGGFWIGWDYAHHGDDKKNFELVDVIKDCCSVIMQLLELNEKE